MDKYRETFDTWDKVAKSYQEKFMALDLYNDSYDFICDSLDQMGPKVLEAGCGPGNITRYLLTRRPDIDLLGIDISSNMISLAKQNNPTAHFEVMDVRQISNLELKFDGIVCGFCLPYLFQDESVKFISASYELLNEDGILYVSFVEGDPERSGFQVSKSGDRVYFNYYSLWWLSDQFMKNGFNIIQQFNVDYKRSEIDVEKHIILVGRKKSTD